MTPEEKRQAALDHLREMLLPGDPVTTLAEYVPYSARNVRVRVLTCAGGRISDLSEYVAVALGIRWDSRRPGVLQRNYPGPGRSVAESLGRVLYPDGWACLGDDGCPSAEHLTSQPAPRQAGLVHHDVCAFRYQEL